jgi:hypothetical protein
MILNNFREGAESHDFLCRVQAVDWYMLSDVRYASAVLRFDCRAEFGPIPAFASPSRSWLPFLPCGLSSLARDCTRLQGSVVRLDLPIDTITTIGCNGTLKTAQ